MKSPTAIACFLFVILASCNRQAYIFTSFHEPAEEGLRILYSYDGYHWNDTKTIFLKPLVGNQKVLRDPSMVQGPDGVFHLVWTSSWRGDKGFGYASSKDLIHWSDQKLIPVMEHEPTTVNVWAPEIHYNAKDKEFLILWSSCIPGRFARGIEADSNNHRIYMTKTKDFESFSQTKLFFDPGYSVIDAVIAQTKNADPVLVFKDNTRPHRYLQAAFSNSLLGSYSQPVPGFTASFTEGPSVVKLKKEWLIYYDAYQQKKYAAASTKDFKTFEDASDRITVPEGHKHGTIVPVSKRFLKKFIQNIPGS